MEINNIDIKDLTKLYNSFVAVDSVSFSVKKGDIVAILGPNGAGKTTLIKMLTGLLSPTKGTISYNSVNFSKSQNKIKKVIGLVPQENNIDRDISVYNNLLIHAILYGINYEERKKAILEALNFGELENYSHRLANELSGGLKRRLVIARAMLHKPKILFLDEPTVNLDPHSRRHIWNFIRKINNESQTTIFITTHYIEEAELLAKNVLIIDGGKIIASGSPDALKSRLGHFTLEIFKSDSIEYQFFHKRDEAIQFAGGLNCSFKIRELTLEDLYIKITGKRIE
jgi:ABC-2 type transport system ATP-binding protein